MPSAAFCQVLEEKYKKYSCSPKSSRSAAAKEQLEASISDDDEYLRETLSLLDTTPSPEGRAELLRMVLSEAAEGGGGGGGAGPSGGA